MKDPVVESYQAEDPTVRMSADKPDPSKGKVSRLEIEVADNGGYIMTVFRRSADGMPERSVIKDLSELDAAIDGALGVTPAVEQEAHAEPMAAPPPPPAPQRMG